MKIWKNCEMIFSYLGNYQPDYSKCQVKLDDEIIEVSYQNGKSWTSYFGKNNNDGHFMLTSQDPKGEATLHMFLKDNKLDGFWVEEGEEGFWRIILKD